MLKLLITPTMWQQWVNNTSQYSFKASLAVTLWKGLTWSNTTFVFDHRENETRHTVSSSETFSQTVSRPETFITCYDSTQMYTLNLKVHVQSIASMAM